MSKRKKDYFEQLYIFLYIAEIQLIQEFKKSVDITYNRFILCLYIYNNLYIINYI